MFDQAKISAPLSAHSKRAYASDWKAYCAWARRSGREVLDPDPLSVAQYLEALAKGAPEVGGRPASRATLHRRLYALAWNYAQRGAQLAVDSPALQSALALGQKAPPREKVVCSQRDLQRMIAALDLSTLRGLRDRAMLLLAYHGKLRRAELVGLDLAALPQAGRGALQVLEQVMIVTLERRGKFHRVEIVRLSKSVFCPVAALEIWLKFARITAGPLFRRVIDEGRAVGDRALSDREFARIVKRAALAAGLAPEFSEAERAQRFSGGSLLGKDNS